MQIGEGKPYLPSAVALIGLFVIFAITAKMGFDYWAVRRGDHEMAWINAGCELIAFGGLAAAFYGWPARWPWIITGTLIAIVMAGACGFTAYQRLAEDEHARSVSAAMQSEIYVGARDDLNAARGDARAWSSADPRPRCTCPETIASWAVAHGQEADRLERVVESGQQAVAALLPTREFSWSAAVRAFVIEVVKFLGFGAFGGVWLYAWNAHRARRHDADLPDPSWGAIDGPQHQPAAMTLPPPRREARPRTLAPVIDAEIGDWGTPPRLPS